MAIRKYLGQIDARLPPLSATIVIATVLALPAARLTASASVQRVWLPPGGRTFQRWSGLKIQHVGLILGKALRLACSVRSRPIVAGGTAEYKISAINCTETKQSVTLSIHQSGWHAMLATIAPAQLALIAGGKAGFNVTVKVPMGIPAGGFESQMIVAIPNGNAADASGPVTDSVIL